MYNTVLYQPSSFNFGGISLIIVTRLAATGLLIIIIVNSLLTG